jgi:hypothetical protein
MRTTEEVADVCSRRKSVHRLRVRLYLPCLNRHAGGQLPETVLFPSRPEKNGGNKMTTSGKPLPGRLKFLAGDEVVLARGSHVGTPGVFVAYRADVKWADIAERDGIIRNHPVEWLEHADAPLAPRLPN